MRGSSQRKKVYYEKCEEYRVLLHENISILLKLNPQVYPHLHKFIAAHQGAVRAKLINLMVEGISKPRYPKVEQRKGRYSPFFSTSIRFLAIKYPGDIPSWCKTLALSAAWGLLVKRKYTFGWDNPDLDNMGVRALNRAKRRGKDRDSFMWPETFYHYPQYSAAVLETAETRAKIWADSGCTRNSISKSAIAALYGQDIADMAYSDARAMSEEDAAAAKELTAALVALIDKNGFTKPEAVFGYAIGDKKRQARVWNHLKAQIIKEQGLRYSRPTKEEKLRWNLTSYAYIIR